MIVVDSSALVDRLVWRPVNRALADRLDGGPLHAPHLIDVECLQTLRRLVAVGEVSDERAAAARDDLAGLPLRRYPHVVLSERIWELRHDLTAYDAAYVALSEVFDMPLVTADSRIADAPGHSARVEVFARA